MRHIMDKTGLLEHQNDENRQWQGTNYKSSKIELRWLDGDDLDQLEPILKARGWMSLNKATTRARAAFDDGKLVGFICIQLVPHMEPLYVDADYRGTGLAGDLVSSMADFVKSSQCRGIMIVASNAGIEQMARHFAMEQIKEPVYMKIDMGEGL